MGRLAVVGGGAAGLTAAVVLARRGHLVTLFECGSDCTEEQFAVRFSEQWRREQILRQPLAATDVLLDTYFGRTVARRAGWAFRSIGGGTAVWGGWAIRPDPADLRLRSTMARWGHDRGDSRFLRDVHDWPIDYAELVPWLAQAEALLGVRRPGGTPRDDPFRTRLPWRFSPVPLTTSGRIRWGIESPRTLSELWPWRQYAYALRSGVDLRSRTRVVGLDVAGPGRAASGLRYITQDVRTGEGRVFRERYDGIVLACGAIQTIRLLLLSGCHQFGTTSSRLVGRRMTFHLLGPRVVLTNVARDRVPPLISRRHTSVVVRRDGERFRLPGGRVSIHSRPAPSGSWRDDRVDGHRECLDLRFTGQDLPCADNRIDLSRTRKDADGYPMPQLRRRSTLGSDLVHRHLSRELGRLASALVLRTPRVSTFREDWQRLGDHHLGGCAMGEDPGASVTAPSGQLHDLPNVFVVDGSVFPSALSVPPTLVVIANALRVAAQI